MSDDKANGAVDNVRDDVAAAVASLKETAGTDQPVESRTAASADAPQEIPPSLAEGRPRDQHGRFASKQAVEQAEAAPAEPVSDADPRPASEPAPSTAPIAPKTWSAEAKAEWSKLPPAIQTAVLKRESEMDSGGARWSEEKRRYDQVIAPVAELAKSNGVDVATGIQRLVAAQQYLDRDPAGAIRWLAQSYGVDLANPQSAPSPRPAADPMVASLYQEVNSLKSHLEQQQTSAVVDQITSFAKDKPHWEALEADITDLIPVVKQRNPGASYAAVLQEAYDMAAWANPQTRQQLLAAQTAEAARKAKERETAERSRRASISLNGAPNGTVPPPTARDNPNATVADDVRAAFAQLRAH